MSIVVKGFYSKGPRVQAEVSVVDGATFSAKREWIDIGYKPSSKARLLKKPAWETIKHGGVEYLLLNQGHVYSVLIDGVSIKLDSERSHSAIDVTGLKLGEISAVEPPE